MFIVEDVQHTETVILDGINLYVQSVVNDFKWLIVCFSALSILVVIVINLSCIKGYVVGPVHDLTNAIINPTKTKTMRKYIEKIIKKRPVIESKNVDEVDRLRMLFGQFFK